MRSTHRRLTAALGLVAASIATSSALAAMSTSADAVLPGTITPVGTVPNYFYQFYKPSDSFTIDTQVFADPANHRIFEFNADYCPQLAEYDADSLALVAAAPSTQQGIAAGGCKQFEAFGFIAPGVAVDPQDGVLLMAFTAGSPDASLTSPSIAVVSEKDLSVINTWSLPPTAGNYVDGLSWYAPADQLLVTSSFQFNNNGGGVFVSAFDVKSGLAHGSTSTQLWSQQALQCQGHIFPAFGFAAGTQGRDSVYVPCMLPPSGSGTGNGRPAIIKLPLATSNCTTSVAPGGCPASQGTESIIPGSASSVLYDPGAERMFIVDQNGQQYIVADVYDGPTATFEGRTGLGIAQVDTGNLVVGLDSTTGRVYSVGAGNGMTVVDGRRTPVSPGQVFRQYAQANKLGQIPVLTPDTAVPYTRVVVPNGHIGTLSNGATGEDYLQGFTLYADTIPLSQDPPPGAVDQNTYSGAVPSGATVAGVYGGTSRAYGFHSDWVGGPNGQLADLSGLPGIPAGQGTKDLLGGSIGNLNASNGANNGSASALQDANGQTAKGVYECTNLQQTGSCMPPPQCLDYTSPPTCTPAGLPAAPVPKTAQVWPVPEASCAQPGDSKQATGGSAGFYATTGYDSTGAPQQTQLPGSAAGATAAVDCTVGKPVTGAANLQSFSTNGTGAPSFTVLGASSQATVTPPTPDGAVTSTADATARSIHVDVPNGGSLDIGQIVHHASASAGGRPGTTATTTSTLTLDNVVANGKTLCGAQCDPSAVLGAINTIFNGALSISVPAPDDRYSNQCTSSAAGETCSGSPGGYVAAVQASLPEQYGDINFNAMTPEEASILPGLRIVLSGYNDGQPVVSREVLDFAGVEVDGELGLQVFPGGLGGYVPAPTSASGRGAPAAVGKSVASSAAESVTGHTLPDESTFAPASLIHIGGTPATAGSGPSSNLRANDQGAAESKLSVIQRAFDGLSALFRSPKEILYMLAFLSLLGLPFILARPRSRWIPSRRRSA